MRQGLEHVAHARQFSHGRHLGIRHRQFQRIDAVNGLVASGKKAVDDTLALKDQVTSLVQQASQFPMKLPTLLGDLKTEFSGQGVIANQQGQGWGTAVANTIWPF